MHLIIQDIFFYLYFISAINEHPPIRIKKFNYVIFKLVIHFFVN